MSANVRQSGGIYRTLGDTTKIEQDHLIVKCSSAGVVELCGSSDTPYACTTKTTYSKRHAVIGEKRYLNGADFPGQVKVIRMGIVDLALATGHGAIAIGDKLVVKSNGQVGSTSDAWGTNDGKVVAIAEETIAAPADSNSRTQETVKAALNFFNIGGI